MFHRQKLITKATPICFSLFFCFCALD